MRIETSDEKPKRIIGKRCITVAVRIPVAAHLKVNMWDDVRFTGNANITDDLAALDPLTAVYGYPAHMAVDSIIAADRIESTMIYRNTLAATSRMAKYPKNGSGCCCNVRWSQVVSADRRNTLS